PGAHLLSQRALAARHPALGPAGAGAGASLLACVPGALADGEGDDGESALPRFALRGEGLASRRGPARRKPQYRLPAVLDERARSPSRGAAPLSYPATAADSSRASRRYR